MHKIRYDVTSNIWASSISNDEINTNTYSDFQNIKQISTCYYYLRTADSTMFSMSDPQGFEGNEWQLYLKTIKRSCTLMVSFQYRLFEDSLWEMKEDSLTQHAGL